MEYSWIRMLCVLGTFLLSAMLGMVVIPNIVLISKKRRLFDPVSDRKAHRGSVPRLGGLSFFPIFLVSFTTLLGLRYSLGYELSPTFADNLVREFMLVTGGSGVLMMAGIVDDIRGIGYKVKFLAQFISALLLVGSLLWIGDLNGLFGLHRIPTWAGIVLTVVAVAFVENAYNLIDGIDGLCAGLAIVAFVSLGGWFLYHYLFVYAMLAAAILGVLVTFFFYNTAFRRMKIFMGDTGSLLLGFLISFLGLKFLDMAPTLSHAIQPLAVLVGIVFIPVFDTLRVFVLRLSKGRSPFFPDRRHIHHQFLDLGFSHLRATGIIILMQIVFIVLNITLYRMNINLVLAIDVALWGAMMVTIRTFLRKRIRRQMQK